jgi:hypothetical protein
MFELFFFGGGGEAGIKKLKLKPMKKKIAAFDKFITLK